MAGGGRVVDEVSMDFIYMIHKTLLHDRESCGSAGEAGTIHSRRQPWWLSLSLDRSTQQHQPILRVKKCTHKKLFNFLLYFARKETSTIVKDNETEIQIFSIFTTFFFCFRNEVQNYLFTFLSSERSKIPPLPCVDKKSCS